MAGVDLGVRENFLVTFISPMPIMSYDVEPDAWLMFNKFG